jgi:cytochrome c553
MSFHSFRVHSRQIDNPAVAGRTIALQICSNCHSVNGISVSPMFPTLGGQPKEFLVNQLMDFRAHLRSDQNVRKFMWGFTHLSDEQIEQLATYYSSRSPPAGVHGDRLVIDDGRTIFISGIPDKACQHAAPVMAYVAKAWAEFHGSQASMPTISLSNCWSSGTLGRVPAAR